jgi:hypothetical protein
VVGSVNPFNVSGRLAACVRLSGRGLFQRAEKSPAEGRQFSLAEPRQISLAPKLLGHVLVDERITEFIGQSVGKHRGQSPIGRCREVLEDMGILLVVRCE